MPARGSLLQRLGVRGRLLLAFLGISAFAVIAAAAAMYSFDEVGKVYLPDYTTLERLLAVPLLLGSTSRSGIPALALDVWIAYELRRAGFEPDRVWPRAQPPRILPRTLIALLKGATRRQRAVLDELLASGKTQCHVG